MSGVEMPRIYIQGEKECDSKAKTNMPFTYDEGTYCIVPTM